jgi:hypothetical protein
MGEAEGSGRSRCTRHSLELCCKLATLGVGSFSQISESFIAKEKLEIWERVEAIGSSFGAAVLAISREICDSPEHCKISLGSDRATFKVFECAKFDDPHPIITQEEEEKVGLGQLKSFDKVHKNNFAFCVGNVFDH